MKLNFNAASVYFSLCCDIKKFWPVLYAYLFRPILMTQMTITMIMITMTMTMASTLCLPLYFDDTNDNHNDNDHYDNDNGQYFMPTSLF